MFGWGGAAAAASLQTTARVLRPQYSIDRYTMNNCMFKLAMHDAGSGSTATDRGPHVRLQPLACTVTYKACSYQRQIRAFKRVRP
jgi:hypothetical protein